MSDIPLTLLHSHTLTPDQVSTVHSLREEASKMDHTIRMNADPGPLLDAARLAISDALMACNRAVSLNPELGQW